MFFIRCSASLLVSHSLLVLDIFLDGLCVARVEEENLESDDTEIQSIHPQTNISELAGVLLNSCTIKTKSL